MACLQQPNHFADREEILRWLECAPITEPAWPRIYTDFVDRFGFCDVAGPLAWKFLREKPDHWSWSHVWERLHAYEGTDSAQSFHIAERWLRKARPDISG